MSLINHNTKHKNMLNISQRSEFGMSKSRFNITFKCTKIVKTCTNYAIKTNKICSKNPKYATD